MPADCAALNRSLENAFRGKRPGYSRIARKEAAEQGLNNLSFKAVNLSTWREPNAFDWILALDAIHDQAHPDKVLDGIFHALRGDGFFLMQDIDASSHLENNMDHPLGPLMYTISCFHCMTVSLAEGGRGLGTVWGRELAGQMLREAGFTRVDVHRFEHDIQNAYYVVRK